MKVNSEILEVIKDDRVLRTKLAKVVGKSPHTVYMWLWGKSENLLRLDALECISDHTRIPVENLIER